MLLSAFLVLAHTLGVLSAIRATMETRTSQGAIAWVVCLVTCPYLAVPAYWVFGRTKFEGYVARLRSSMPQNEQRVRAYMQQLRERDLLAEVSSDRARLVERLAKLPATQGNEALLLVDGEATFCSIFEGIDGARDYVLVEFYILRDDALGKELERRLAARSAAGVRVYVLFDELGSGSEVRDLEQRLRSAGVSVHPFGTRRGRANRFQLNFRNHRKIVVVDGCCAWVGGHNVGDEYMGRDPRVGPWRDTHVMVEGPVVQGVQAVFAEDWHWATGQGLDLLWEPRRARGGASRKALCLPSSPADPLETCTLFNLNLINSATKRLWIASPYFVPDEQFLSALQLAALRGVDVRVIVPEKSDNRLVQLSGWSYVEELERVGIRFWRHNKGFMHQKVLLMDDEVCTIGTANFDNRSFRLNFEITMVFQDKDFAQQVQRMLEQDLADSRCVSASEVRELPYFRRLAIRASRLMAPIQ